MTDCGVSPNLTARLRLKRAKLANASLRVAVELGGLLIEAKRQCRHGEWEDYVKVTYDGSLREAQRYMKLAKELDPDNLPDVSLRQALAMLAKSRAKPQIFTHELLHPDTLEAAMSAAGKAHAAIVEELMAALLEEGVTKAHYAMRLADKAAASVKGLFDYLRQQKACHLAGVTEDLVAESGQTQE
jgi:hypothetical protein